MELIKVDLSGLGNAKRFFKGAADRLADMKPVWEAAHDIFTSEMTEQFQSQGAFLLGEQWQPLNPKYAERKHRIYGEPPAPFGILYRTGELYQSLVDEGHGSHVKVIEPGGAIFGSTVPYGRFHQTGATIHASDGGTWELPQRKIVHVRARTSQWLTRLAITWILRGRAVRVYGSRVEWTG